VGTNSDGIVARAAGAATEFSPYTSLEAAPLSSLQTNRYGTAVAPPSRPATARTERRASLPDERRSSHRYPIDLPVQYEDGRNQFLEGRVVNMSSGGILFHSDRALAPGRRVRLRVAWPVRLNDVMPLALHIEGQTVRAEGNFTAVKILRSEFRTRPVCRPAEPSR
jgi:PilZ domain